MRVFIPTDDPDACWIWQGAKMTKGYGVVHFNGKLIGAHRMAWILANGPIPEGKYVCHSCDVRTCVNPAHLWLGTAQSNNEDAWAKGRAQGPKVDPSEWKHGTRGTYIIRGCRCESCVEANRVYNREYQRKYRVGRKRVGTKYVPRGQLSDDFSEDSR
jgi:hypothetical protein